MRCALVQLVGVAVRVCAGGGTLCYDGRSHVGSVDLGSPAGCLPLGP